MLSIPPKLAAGATLVARLDDAAHPSPDWTGELVLSGPAVVQVEGTAGPGAALSFTAAATFTATWLAGAYAWTARLTRASDGLVEDVDQGVLTLSPDPASPDPDPRYQRVVEVEADLAAIDLVLRGVATAGIAAYTLGDRSVTRYGVGDLLRLRKQFEQRLSVLRGGSPTVAGLVRIP